MTTNIIVPRRDERFLNGDMASQRYIEFFEQLGQSVNTGDDTDTTFIISSPSFTTTGSGNIICTAITTINLDFTPIDRDLVVVTRTNGPVTVDAGGKLMSGDTEIIITRDYTSLNFRYSLEINEWIIE